MQEDVRDFSGGYTFQDFKDLVIDCAAEGLKNDVECDGISFAAECLYYDFSEQRANAFGYVTGRMTGRTLLEIRKSAILQLPSEFISWFSPSFSHKDIIERRVQYLTRFFADYEDKNWQYDWMIHLFIPKDKRDWLEYTFEEFVEDGDLARDKWVDPLWQWRFKKLYWFNE